MLYAIRRMRAEELAALPDVGEGFENVLTAAFEKQDRSPNFTKRSRQSAIRSRAASASSQARCLASPPIRCEDSCKAMKAAISGARLSQAGARSHQRNRAEKDSPADHSQQRSGCLSPFIRQNVETDLLRRIS
jgi:hypothetical protein